MPRIAVIAGTRPEAIKIAPLMLALAREQRLEARLLATGQHGEVFDQVLAMFGLQADIDLALHSPGQTLNGFIARALVGIDDALERLQPDMVVVQGDTSTAMVGALAAFNRRIPVTHLEAGLRSDDLDSPFPEEANRRLISQIASWHLAATPSNGERLRAERIDPARVMVTGNTVIDALFEVIERRPAIADPQLARLLATTGPPLVAVTAHRRESWGEPLTEIARAVRDIAARNEVRIVWPLHPNPAVRACVEPVLAGCSDVVLTEPLGYGDFSQLIAASSLVLSDSGGVQEEAPALGCPVVVLREVTERTEALRCGAAVLAGTDRARIVSRAEVFLRGPAVQVVSPYGDGRASARCVATILHAIHGDRRPDEFEPTGSHPSPLCAAG